MLSLIAMMVMFIEIMLVPALPIIAQDYSVGADWISWVLSVYLLVGAIATPLAGKLGDLYGKKRVMLITMVMNTIGLLGCGFSWSFSDLLSFRAIQGMGVTYSP